MKKNYYLILFTLLVLASIPSLWHKMNTENSANTIEFSIDYLSLLSLSEQSENPAIYLDAMLKELKSEGFTTLTVPNNTFSSLEDRGLVSVLTSEELNSIQLLADNPIPLDRHLTYVLFLDPSTEKELTAMMHTRFATEHLERFTMNNRTLMGIDMPLTKLLNASIPYLESDLDFLTNPPYDFSLVLKLDNNWQGNEAVAVSQLNSIPSGKISNIYFADSGVLGFPLTHEETVQTLPLAPFAYKEYFAAEEKQKGIDWLAKYSEYNLVRLHVIPHKLFEDNLDSSHVLVDRITKAASERNIRLFHLQFPWKVDGKNGKQLFTTSFSILKESKEKLGQKGFTVGTSEPFSDKTPAWLTASQWSAALAGLLLVFLVIQSILPKRSVYLLSLLIVLLISSIWIQPLPWQAIAFLSAVFMPLFGVIICLKMNEKWRDTTVLKSMGLFLGFSIFSIVGGLLLSSMHSELPHLLYIAPFRGVSLAHILPSVLAFILMLVYYNKLNKNNFWNIAASPVRIYHMALLFIVAFLGAYYVSRTGNSGILLPFEMEFRNLLESLFGVRPRTKEFLLAHPLMMLVFYYWHQHKWVKWGLPIAIIGQLSIINTFTHFHTPVLISLQRAIYGVGLGVLIGLLLIGCIEIVKWVIKQKQLHKS